MNRSGQTGVLVGPFAGVNLLTAKGVAPKRCCCHPGSGAFPSLCDAKNLTLFRVSTERPIVKLTDIIIIKNVYKKQNTKKPPQNNWISSIAKWYIRTENYVIGYTRFSSLLVQLTIV
jgi:hypothetical protein